MVKSETGNFLKDGVRCDLYSINGLGEIRWSVSNWCPDKEQQAAIKAFGVENVLTAGMFK
jgi:hypothetical protein